MAYLTIKSFWHYSVYYKIKEGEYRGLASYSNVGGYNSLEEMQTELIRRFPHRNPELIPNGVRMEGDCRTYQEVTWE